MSLKKEAERHTPCSPLGPFPEQEILDYTAHDPTTRSTEGTRIGPSAEMVFDLVDWIASAAV